MKLAWGYGGRGRGGWYGPWPGRGPFSYLPPWERPGWLYGRGACWWLFGPWALYGQSPFTRYSYSPPYAPPYAPASLEDEISALQEAKRDLEEELKGIDARIAELKKTMETKK